MLAEVTLLVLGVAAYFWYKLQQKVRYWDDLGVKNDPYQFPFGSSAVFGNDIAFNRLNANDAASNQYKKFAGEKYYGTYVLTRPALTICDPEIIKAITVKDFHHFVDRNSETTMKMFFGGGTKTDQIWSKQMTSVGGETWKNLRTTFSPIFTSGKMKMMVTFIQEVSSRLVESFEEEAKAGREFELKQKFGKFSMDTIASCAFGMDAQSFTNPKSTFVENARQVFRRDLVDVLKFMMVFTPGGSKFLGMFGIPVFKPKETSFFYDVISTTLKEREKSGLRRNDLIDMMLDALKEDMVDTDEGVVADEDVSENLEAKLDHKASKKDFDELTIVATAIVMLVAGYDTTGQTLSYIAYELAKNPDIQRRLQDEIDTAIEKSDGKMPDYTTTQSMQYLDMVFHETLRLHPAVGMLTRGCVLDYKIPGTNIEIKKGDEVYINSAGIHADPKHYPDPEKFDPERFSKESKAARHPYAYLPFGVGPRSCIGMRFATLEAKMALIAVLSKFNFVRCSKTVEKVTLDPASVLGASKEGLYIKVEPRN